MWNNRVWTDLNEKKLPKAAPRSSITRRFLKAEAAFVRFSRDSGAVTRGALKSPLENVPQEKNMFQKRNEPFFKNLMIDKMSTLNLDLIFSLV